MHPFTKLFNQIIYKTILLSSIKSVESYSEFWNILVSNKTSSTALNILLIGILRIVH